MCFSVLFIQSFPLINLHKSKFGLISKTTPKCLRDYEIQENTYEQI
jgi:hypothetical protein